MCGRRRAERARDGRQRDQSHPPAHAWEARCGPEGGGSSRGVLQLGLALNFETTVRIERVISGELEPHVLEIVLRVLTEAKGHRLQARALWPRISRPRIRRAHDFGHVEERRVRELILLDDRLKAAPFVAAFLVVE